MKKSILLLVLVSLFSLLFMQFAFCGAVHSQFVVSTAAYRTSPCKKAAPVDGFRHKSVAVVRTFDNNSDRNINSATNELHYIWLNLTGANGLFCQMAFGYRTEATNGVDDFDSTRIDGQFTLNSLIEASNNDYVIQSRAVPFCQNDVVMLSTKIPVSGMYIIAIDHTLGMFSGGQEVILIDRVTNTAHNLTCSSYTFTANAGYSTNRFAVEYQSRLSVVEAKYENELAVYRSNSDLVINSESKVISAVRIFDIQGRMLLEKSNLNQNKVEIPISFTNQVVVISATLDEGQVISKKFLQ